MAKLSTFRPKGSEKCVAFHGHSCLGLAIVFRGPGSGACGQDKPAISGLAGQGNQMLPQHAGEVILMMAGIPVKVKPAQ